jgi:PAS domain S-box-containing protein
MTLVGQTHPVYRKLQDLPSAGEASSGFWICEPARDHLWLSDGFFLVSNLKEPDTTINLSAFCARMEPDDRRAFTTMIERVCAEQVSLNLQIQLKQSDGTTRRLNLKAQPLAVKGKAVQVIGLAREAADPGTEELLRLRRDMKSLMEHSPDVVVRFDESGTILLASRTFQNLFKTGSGMNGSLLPHLRDLGRKALSERAPQKQEYCVERLGRLQWVETCAIPDIDADTKIATAITFTRDVTDRKLNEEQLESSKRWLLVAMESMELAHDAAGMGYWDRDLTTNTMHWSDRVYTIFGRTPASSTPSYEEWSNIAQPEDQQFREAAIKQAYGPTGKYRCQYRAHLPGVGVRWLEENGKLIRDFTGSPTRMIGTLTDITEQKEQEEALVHFEKLSSAMRLSSTLAHEINNPLTAVTYLLHLALQDQTLQTATRHNLVAAQEELARAAHVASQTLSLYRPMSERSTVDVSAMVRDVLGIYRHRLRSKRVEPVARLDEAALALVTATELRQILSNLLVNAMDAAAVCGKRLVIRVRNIRVSSPVPMVQITVADEGPGIERALRNKVFEPFFTTKGEHGIGLGLWVTRELVKRNSGSIAVRSCTALKNSWTAFVMTFPAAQAAAAEHCIGKSATQAA